MVKKFIIMNQKKDNCATALVELPENEDVKIKEDLTVRVNRKIPFGHKFALKDINEGEYVYKYGEIIGKASSDIKKGDWIHTKNLKSAYMEVVRNG